MKKRERKKVFFFTHPQQHTFVTLFQVHLQTPNQYQGQLARLLPVQHCLQVVPLPHVVPARQHGSLPHL
jgi:hypothetical protein